MTKHEMTQGSIDKIHRWSGKLACLMELVAKAGVALEKSDENTAMEVFQDIGLSVAQLYCAEFTNDMDIFKEFYNRKTDQWIFEQLKKEAKNKGKS